MRLLTMLPLERLQNRIYFTYLGWPLILDSKIDMNVNEKLKKYLGLMA